MEGSAGRSRMAQFGAQRSAFNRKESARRARQRNILDHLAFSLFVTANQLPMHESELLNGVDEEPWVCKGCGTAIWLRQRRKQCYLQQSVVLEKPTLDARKEAKAMKVCLECKKNHFAIQKFAEFQLAFDRTLKVDRFYAAYKKLRKQIESAMQSFGGLVISFVEKEFKAEKELYVKCKEEQQMLTSHFAALTALMKKLIAAKFDSKREELIGHNLKNCIAEWISESLAQMRALESSWKQVRIGEVAIQRKSVSSSTLPKVSSGLKVASISPIVVPRSGARIVIAFEDALGESDVSVFVEGVKCEVESKAANQLSVIAPALSEGPKDVKLVGGNSELLLPKILNYQNFSPKNRRSEEQEDEEKVSLEKEIFAEKMMLEETPDDVVIFSLEPVLSPMSGTMLEMTGQNLGAEVLVLVDGVSSDFVEVLSDDHKDRICFLSPKLLVGGFKTVEVINLTTKKSAKLENILFYNDE